MGSTRKALRARCWGEVGSHVPPADTCPLQTGDTATSNEQALTVRTRRRGPAAAVASCTCLGPSGRSVGRSVCWSGGEGVPVPAPRRLPRWIREEGSPFTSPCTVSADSSSGWGRDQAVQRCPCWWFCFSGIFFFKRKNMHFYAFLDPCEAPGTWI